MNSGIPAHPLTRRVPGAQATIPTERPVYSEAAIEEGFDRAGIPTAPFRPEHVPKHSLDARERAATKRSPHEIGRVALPFGVQKIRDNEELGRVLQERRDLRVKEISSNVPDSAKIREQWTELAPRITDEDMELAKAETRAHVATLRERYAKNQSKRHRQGWMQEVHSYITRKRRTAD
jgi:hypothetical protein